MVIKYPVILYKDAIIVLKRSGLPFGSSRKYYNLYLCGEI